MTAAADLAAAKGDLSVQIADARARFWAAYPDGSDREAAEIEFSRALFAKDWAYLAFYVPQGPLAVRSKLVAGIGGQIDGGIPDAPRTFYYGWVFKLREALGAKEHAPDPSRGIKEPDLVWFTPDKLIRALGEKEVQEAYDAYKIARDRAEFAAVGRQDEFDEIVLKSRQPGKVAQPTVEAAGMGITVKYGQVPEDFVPPMEHPLSDTVNQVYYDMQKMLPGSLFRISIMPCCYFLNHDLRGDTERTFIRDMMQTRVEKASVISCQYLSDRANVAPVRQYWYKTRPAAADPAALQARLPNHPILQVRDPRETCPATLSEATRD